MAVHFMNLLGEQGNINLNQEVSDVLAGVIAQDHMGE
jgi:hypothetical protein